MATNITAQIMELDGGVWDANGFSSRPSGAQRRVYLEQMVDALNAASISPSQITERVIYELEDENYHSAISALDVFVGNTTIDDLMEREKQLGY